MSDSQVLKLIPEAPSIRTPRPLDIVPRSVSSLREQRNFQIQSLSHGSNEETRSNHSSSHMRTIQFGVDDSLQDLVVDDFTTAKHFKRSGKPFLAIKPFEEECMNIALGLDPFVEPLP